MSQPSLADVDLPAIVKRYANGESVQVLAAECGVTRNTIYAWMLYEVGPEYKDLVKRALARKAADAEIELEDADNALSAARARERCRFTRMDYERRCPEVYGVKQQIQEDRTIRVIYADPTPQPVVEAPVVIEAVNVSAQLLTDQQSDAPGGPTTVGDGQS